MLSFLFLFREHRLCGHQSAYQLDQLIIINLFYFFCLIFLLILLLIL